MIAAPSVEAICRDDYLLVLGELHVATNTSDATVFLAQHPHPQDLIDAFARDVPEPVVIPVNSKDWPKMTARTQRALVSPSTLFLESGFDPARGSRENVLTSGALVVEDIDGKLCVRTPGGVTIPLMDLFAEVLSSQIVSEFRFLPRGDHTPRVTIDKLVICRESWSFFPASMDFADEPDDMGRFLGARRWARKHGIPRLAYVRSPLETKPVFVDFDHHVRDAADPRSDVARGRGRRALHVRAAARVRRQCSLRFCGGPLPRRLDDPGGVVDGQVLV